MTWLTLLKNGGPYLVVLVVIAGITFGGWTARGWYEGKKDLAELKAAQAAINAAMARESDIAQAVEEKLAALKANQTVIDRGVIREVVKPVYQRVCFEPDLVRMLNLESGEALPADLADQVPGDAEQAD